MLLLLTASDASRRLHGRLTPAAIRSAAARGHLPVAVRTPGGVRLFSPEAIDQYAKTHGRDGD
jgi:DNA-binding transcriptional MerR regulator